MLRSQRMVFSLSSFTSSSTPALSIRLLPSRCLFVADTFPTRYPYPLFDKLSPPQRVLLFAGSAAMMTLSTSGLKMLYEGVNGKDLAVVGTKHSQKKTS